MSNQYITNKEQLLSNLVGYVESRELIAEREKIGSDFSEDKGKNTAEIAKLHPKRLNLEVTEIFQETPSTKTFRVRSARGALPPFQAGQYINLFVNIDGVETARPYAISSCPTHRDYYDLTVK
ncbi:FAD-binding oxidoreductase, partial [Oleiphilus sp. HI0125]